MTPIKDISNFPDKCPVKQIQGKVVEVYPAKQANGKSKQSFLVEDGGGNKVMVNAWEHQDLSYYKGKEVILNEGPKGGMSVNEYNGKKSLNFSRTCTIQLVGSHGGTASNNVQVDNSQVQVSGAPNGLKPINGMTVGMSINNVCANLTAQGLDLDTKVIYEKASAIIRLAQHMEAGNLAPKPGAAPAPEPVKVEPVAPKPAPQENLDEDVPF